MKIQESGEMYLETILLLSKQKEHVRAIDVAEYMGFSKPSVSRALGVLKEAGLVCIDEKSFLCLSEKGYKTAEKIYDRHITLTGFFEKIGVPVDVASVDACKIEHIISEESFEAIKKHLENLPK